jgi:DNA-binding transcriptional LysR family regulator
VEIQQIRYFLRLASTLNFTRAAESAGVSQPALTRSIQNLEAELGGPLFHRERQRTHLTELGRIMQPYFESVMMQIAMARSRADALKRSAGGMLKLGVMCTIGPGVVSSFVVRFSSLYPDVEVVVSEASARELTDMLKGGELHLALLGMPTELDDRLHAVALFRERFRIALAPDHPLAAKTALRGADLNGQAYVNRAKCEYLEYAREQFAMRGIRTRTVFSSERDDWVQDMVRQGLGFGFFPEFAVTHPGLVTRPLSEPDFERTIQLVTVRGRPHSPSVGAFVSRARSHRWPKPGKDR